MNNRKELELKNLLISTMDKLVKESISSLVTAIRSVDNLMQEYPDEQSAAYLKVHRDGLKSLYNARREEQRELKATREAVLAELKRVRRSSNGS